MKTIGIQLICTFFLVLTLSACGSSNNASTSDKNNSTNQAAPPSMQSINKVLPPEEFLSFVESKNPLLIDLRSPEELKETGYIKGAQNINFYDSDFKENIGKLAKDKPIMVYCASGGRSGKTAKMMKALKFKEVYDLKGGMNAWLAKNMAVEK